MFTVVLGIWYIYLLSWVLFGRRSGFLPGSYPAAVRYINSRRNKNAAQFKISLYVIFSLFADYFSSGFRAAG
jgi:hypothetical protein